ncbi:MAG: hypothetical protein R2867_19350 [Caldilineaceae bacterium]
MIFAFCAYRGLRGLGHISLLTTQWLPLTLLLAHQCWQHPTVKRGLALGVTSALTALASPFYIGLFLLPVTVGGGLILLLRRPRALLRRDLWQATASAGAMAALLVAPFYAHYLFLDAEIYAITSKLSQQAVAGSADLLSWVLPPGMNAVWGRVTGPFYSHFTTPNLMETTVFVGFLPLALFLLSWFGPKPSLTLRFWQILALVTMVLSLGPTLHVNGQPFVDGLPYGWLLMVPGFDGFRIPSRAGITAALALSVIAMLVVQQFSVHQQFRWRWRMGLGLFVVIYLVNVSPFYPHPLTDVRVPAIYNALSGMDQGRAILELPAGEYNNNGYNFFPDVSLWMSYQRTHHHPTISGYLGRRPARLHEPERTLPFVHRFFNDTPGQISARSISGSPFCGRNHSGRKRFQQAPTLTPDQAGIESGCACVVHVEQGAFNASCAHPVDPNAAGLHRRS